MDTDWDLPQPFTLEVTPEAEDIDGLGHTNNAVYIQWCEEVAWAHSASLGLDLAAYQRLDRAMAITHAEYDYLRAAYQSEQLVVATWIVEWDGRLSMDRRFQIRRLKDGVTVLRGRVRFVCIELSSGKPKRMPSEFVEGYGPAIIPP